MKKENLIFKLFALVLAIAVFALDQWSKALVLAEPRLISHADIEITGFFNLVLTFNRGVSFGMFAGHNQPLLLTAVSLVIVAVLLVWLARTHEKMVAIAIGSIIGGALGNVYDRARLGAVVDFLDFHIGNLHWPAFNVADSCVFLGVATLAIHSFFFENK